MLQPQFWLCPYVPLIFRPRIMKKASNGFVAQFEAYLLIDIQASSERLEKNDLVVASGIEPPTTTMSR